MLPHLQRNHHHHRTARHLIAKPHRNCRTHPLPSPTSRSLRPKVIYTAHGTRPAKGILIVVHQISESDAFAQLKRHSQNHNIKLRDVANDFVAAHTAHPLPDTLTMTGT